TTPATRIVGPTIPIYEPGTARTPTPIPSLGLTPALLRLPGQMDSVWWPCGVQGSCIFPISAADAGDGEHHLDRSRFPVRASRSLPDPGVAEGPPLEGTG